jgi:hypothetical protein
MAVMKKSVRKKLSKYLARLEKKHGAEMTLALVTGIVSSLAADSQAKADRKAKAGKAAKEKKRDKAAKAAKPGKGKPDKDKAADRPEQAAMPEPGAAGRKPGKAPAKPVVVVRKRAER